MQELAKYREKMQEVQENATQDMAGDWDKRAVEDAELFIAVTDNSQDYYWSGIKDTHELLLPIYDKLEERGSVLDVGCGAGRILQHMARMFEWSTGMDVSRQMLKLAAVNCPLSTVIPIDGKSLGKLSSDQYDFIYCIYVFDHVPKKEWTVSLIDDIFRVLKPGGYARLVIAIHEESEDDRNTWSGALWTLPEWEECIANAGFTGVSHDITVDRKSLVIGVDQKMCYTTARKAKA